MKKTEQAYNLVSLLFERAGIKKPKNRKGLRKRRLPKPLRAGMALLTRGILIPHDQRDESDVHIHPRHLRRKKAGRHG